jgi:hypothetical protein
MALLRSKVALGIIASAYAGCAGTAVSQRVEYSLPTAPSEDDIIEMGVIPAGCRVVDVILDADDLDTDASPAIALDVGIMSGDPGVDDDARTCGAEFFSASAVAQAGGVARPTLKTAFRVEPVDHDRSVGIKIGTAAATFAAGKIGLTLITATD